MAKTKAVCAHSSGKSRNEGMEDASESYWAKGTHLSQLLAWYQGLVLPWRQCSTVSGTSGMSNKDLSHWIKRHSNFYDVFFHLVSALKHRNHFPFFSTFVLAVWWKRTRCFWNHPCGEIGWWWQWDKCEEEIQEKEKNVFAVALWRRSWGCLVCARACVCVCARVVDTVLMDGDEAVHESNGEGFIKR